MWGLGFPSPLWLVVLILFVPDLALVAYAFGPKIGALAYNAVHLYGFGLMVSLVGLLRQDDFLMIAGALWFAHAGFDRMLGYGLKPPGDFRSIHMGRFGRG